MKKKKVFILILVLIIVLLIIGLLTISFGREKFGLYSQNEFWEGVLIEAHGMILDTLIIGLIILGLNNLMEKRREINQLHTQIDYNRHIRTIESKHRIVSCVQSLNNKKISKMDLHQCDLSHLVLPNKKLSNSSLHATVFSYTNLKNSDLSKVNAERPYFNKSRINNVCFDGSRLHRAEFNESIAKSTSFKNCNIFRTKFDSSNLNNADFRNSHFNKVSFVNSILRNADFRDCTFGDQISFSGADLQSSNFESSKNLDPNIILLAQSVKKAKFDPQIVKELKRLNPNIKI